jgi:hypothetical protein
MQTKKLQIIRPALARASSQPRCSLALAALLLLLGQGAAPARATATIINTAVTAPVTVNSGDELDIIAGGSVTVGLAAALTINAGGTVSISGGSVSGLIGVQMLGGTLKISSGSVHGDATGIFGGTVIISGGSVSSYAEALFVAGAGSTLQMSGGSVTMGDVKILDGATAVISGGLASAEVIAYGGGMVAISGCSALTNPRPGAFGGTAYSLTGALLDGTPINTTAVVFPPGQIVLDNQCTPGSLVVLVADFVTDPAVAQGLTDKLNAIATAIAQGNANAKAGAVGAFINQINAQTGKGISPAQAAILIQLVSAL